MRTTDARHIRGFELAVIRADIRIRDSTDGAVRHMFPIYKHDPLTGTIRLCTLSQPCLETLPPVHAYRFPSTLSDKTSP